MTHFPAATHYPLTTFINADLILVCSGELRSFAQQLESCGLLVLGVHQTDDGLWKASLAFDHENGEANFQAVMDGILRCVETLPAALLKRWNALQSKTLDMGFEAGTKTRYYSRQVSVTLLRRMTAANLELAITIYAPVAEPRSPVLM